VPIPVLATGDDESVIRDDEHVPADPDPDRIAAAIERARHGIAGDNPSDA
jgi:hypothetical protein